MEVSELLPTGRFTPAQLDLLKLFATEMPEEDWVAVRDFAKNYFAKKLTNEVDALFEKNNWDNNFILALSKEHLRIPAKK